MGAAGLRLPGDRRVLLRRHLLLQLHQDRPAAGRAARGGGPGADGGGRGRGRPRGAARCASPAARCRSSSTRTAATACSTGSTTSRSRCRRPSEISDLRGLARTSRSRHPESLGTCPTSLCSPATGSAPKWRPPPSKSSTPSPTTRAYDEHPAGGAAIDAPRRRRSPTRRWRPARPPTPSCSARSAAPSGTPTSPAPSGPSRALFRLRADLGLYANLRPIRPLPRALRRLAAQARADRGRRHADRARAHRRPLLRRARHRGRPRVRHDGLHRRGDRADRARRRSRPRSRA